MVPISKSFFEKTSHSLRTRFSTLIHWSLGKWERAAAGSHLVLFLEASLAAWILLTSAVILIGFNSRGINVATVAKFPSNYWISQLLQIKMPLFVGLKTGIFNDLDFEGSNVTKFTVKVWSELKTNFGSKATRIVFLPITLLLTNENEFGVILIFLALLTVSVKSKV